jgi:hypothetical protein
VEDGVAATAVGVSVGTVDGRLQASIASTRASIDNKFRDFIASPFVGDHYLMQESQRWQ